MAKESIEQRLRRVERDLRPLGRFANDEESTHEDIADLYRQLVALRKKVEDHEEKVTRLVNRINGVVMEEKAAAVVEAAHKEREAREKPAPRKPGRKPAG